MIRGSIGGILLLSVGAMAHAKSTYNPMKDCGSAKVVSGDTCSNVKVEMTFDGCEYKSEPKIAKRIICDGTTIKARFDEAGYRYEAKFNKAEGAAGWGGGVKWEPMGPVKQFSEEKAKPVAKSAPEAPKSSAKEPAREPAGGAIAPVMPPAVPPNAAVQPAPASPFKFSGFVDARYSTFDAKKNPNETTARAESGFGIEDGAVYANYDKDRFAMVVDIAFRRGKSSDVGGANGNASDNAVIGIGLDKSQIYMRYKLTDSLVVDFGQFDTIYGVELNDSKDRNFGKTGLVYDQTLPVTHTGLMVEYLNNGFYGKIFAANPNNKGSYGVSAANDTNTEYGAALGWSNENFRAQAGYMTRPISKADGTGNEDRTLMDVTAGTTWGAFALDAEYNILKDPNKNTLTSAVNTDSEKDGTGLLVMASYKMDPCMMALRYEHITNDPAGKSQKSGDSYGVAYHHKLTSELELRTEYIGYTFKPVGGGDDIKDSRFNVGALVVF